MFDDLPTYLSGHRGQFLPLDQPRNPQGEPRKAGFEIEYNGLPLKKCAQLLRNAFRGKLVEHSPLSYEIEESELGTLKLEADWQLAQQLATFDSASLPPAFNQAIQNSGLALAEAASIAVPWEVITPPLLQEQFPLLEELRKVLYENGAQGTWDSFIHAFGTHVNPEISSASVESILSHLRAFIVLYPQLVKALHVHPTRRILSFIDPFPRQYQQIVLDPAYRPTRQEMVQDYLDHNASRNRALDLLPLFLELEPELVSKLDDSALRLVSARPAYHYRLPNADCGDPNWRISEVWNSWVAIEQLALDGDALDHYMNTFNPQ